MKVKLFQISPEEDRYNLLYMHYEFAMSHGGIKESSYELVFDGELDAKTLNDFWYIFNKKHPEGYRGRSMSTSDVVWAEGLGTFFCDSIGFKPIKFNQKKCPWRKFDG